MIRADRMQRRPLDNVIGIDPGEAGPVEVGEIGFVPRGQQNDTMDPARLQDRVEPLHGNTRVADGKFFHLEPQLGRARFGANHEFTMIPDRARWAGPAR